MSTGGGSAAAALTIDVLTNLAGLGSGLAQAEAQVGQAASNMGRKMDAALGQSMSQRLMTGLKSAFSVAAVADLVGTIADQMNRQFGSRLDFFKVVQGSINDFVRSVPVLGAPVGNVASLFERYGEEIGLRFAEGMLNGQAQGVTSARRFHAGTSPRAEDLPWYMQMLTPTAGYATAAAGGNPMTAPYGIGTARGDMMGVPVGANENMISGLRDELAELMARQTLLMRQDERSRMIQSRLPMVQGEVQAAFGTFRFGVGGPEQASREVVKIAGQQLQAQDRIKQIIETIGQQFSGGN
jgi:hypothetical protein